MHSRGRFALIVALTLASAAWEQPASAQVVSPVVGADRKVTFRLRAPQAKEPRWAPTLSPALEAP